PCRYVDPVPVNSPVVMLDHIAEVDADAEGHATLLDPACVQLGKPVLNFNCSTHRFYGADEFCKDTVTGGIDETAAMVLDAFAEKRTGIVKREKGSRFIVGHKSRIASDIGCEDRDQFSFIHWTPSH